MHRRHAIPKNNDNHGNDDSTSPVTIPSSSSSSLPFLKKQQRQNTTPTNLFNKILCFLILVLVTTIGAYTMVLFANSTNDNSDSNQNNSWLRKQISSSITTHERTNKDGKNAYNLDDKTKNSNHYNNNMKNVDNDDMDPVIRIFQEANVTLSPDDIKTLPSWSQITQLHGPKPIVVGNLGSSQKSPPNYNDTCATYRKLVPPLERMLGCAGMFNTGTNVITKLLKSNCVIPERYEKYGPGQSKESYGMRWQVPWGKHTPAHYKLEHATEKAKAINKNYILPVVTIRNPYDWMKSMCKHNYEARWPHQRICPHLADLVDDPHNNKKKKPSLVPVNVTIRERVVHDSLAHLWNDWYNEYYRDANYPIVMVRFEDIIFHTKETTKQICECAGGKLTADEERPFQYIVDSAKDGPGHGKENQRTGMVDAWTKYGQQPPLKGGFNNLDFQMAKQYLDSKLMSTFDYRHPPS